MNKPSRTFPSGAAWPALRPGAVHVWRLPLGLSAAWIARLLRLLDAAERHRADRFVFAGDRDRFIAAHGILRQVLGRYLGRRAESIRFVTGPHGKPEIGCEAVEQPAPGGVLRTSDLRFSLSHSKDIALLGVCRGWNIGVDVEVHRPLADAVEIARANFSAGEISQLLALLPSERLRAFFDCWTRKEAFVKALGVGLSTPLDRFEVAVGPGRGPAVLSVDGCERAGRRWLLYEGAAGPGTSSTVAVQSTSIDEISFFIWSDPQCGGEESAARD